MSVEKLIESLKTPAGGWKRADLAKLGIGWPPPKGWKKRLIKEYEIMGKATGNELTDELGRNELAISHLEGDVNAGTLDPGDVTFARSLLDQYRRKGRLSDKQWHYVREINGRG